MRILHTADWHLGHTLMGWSRDMEHRQWLTDLADIIEAEEVDVMLVSGDVYDGINPSGESQKILYDAIASFVERRPNLKIIMTSGNHDPSGRLEAPEAILAGKGCHVVGTVRRYDGMIDNDKHLVPLVGADGEIEAFVLAIPFLRASDLPGVIFARDDDEMSPVAQAAHRFIHDLMDEMRPLTSGKPVIAMAHMHVMNGRESEESERRILLGGEHAVPAGVFPDDICYVALGHLHMPQNLDGGRIRYPGSSFPMSATEANYRHGVTILDLSENGVEHRHVEMPRPADFVRIPERGQVLIGDLEAEIRAIGLDEGQVVELRPFVHITLAASGPASVIRAEAERIVASLPVRLSALRIVREAAEDDHSLPAQSLSEIRVDELFARAFLKVNGTDPEPRHIAAFTEIAGTI